MILKASITAMAQGLQTEFYQTGGTGPFTYEVVAGGVGGTIDADGIYTAPEAATGVDTIMVTDSLLATSTRQIKVCTPLELFCDILETEMGLANGRVFLWDQKIMAPKDSGIYIAVGVVMANPFGSSTKMDGAGSGLDAIQSINMKATLSIDIISRGPDARDRKEDVVLALDSIYARQQQEANSFYVGKLTTGFVNLSSEDGAAIPYRYNMSVSLQYAYKKRKAVPYFDQFDDSEITNEP